MLPSMAGRPGVAGRRCLGVAKDDRRKTGVSEVVAVFVGENNAGSEKRTLLDLRVNGVLALTLLSDATRGFIGDESTLLLLFGLRRAIGMSISEVLRDAIKSEETLVADEEWFLMILSEILR